MIHVQLAPSMPSTLVSDYHFNGGLPPIHQGRNIAREWENTSVPRGEHNHTPPIGHIPRPGDGYEHRNNGLPSPPPSHPPRMGSGDGNPILAANIGGQQYRRVPVVASNAPPYQTQQPTVDNSRTVNTRQPFYNTYYSANRPQSPVLPKEDNAAQNKQTARRRALSDGNSIASHLQIPASVNDSKGSLPEFAAQITCFFWFESSFTIHLVEDAPNPLTPTAPLGPEAMPTTGFRKWVTTILSMTQVTQNVILLALMFIYRLKKLNPQVKGKVGSEFRLLTVALMLGNKFLDDNTYTNKTWAEVSGISVQEIHVMEVEFLSNMRYTLFASEEQWNAWHIKLAKFSDYYDKATRVQSGLRNLSLPSPFPNVPPHLPSPPVSLNTSPALLSQTSVLPHPLSTTTYLNQSMSSPVTPMPDNDYRPFPRKRSLDDHTSEPPSKRLSSMGPSAASSTTLTPSTLKSNTPPVPRLPMPNLSVAIGHANNGYGPSSGQFPMPSGRAMSTVFLGANRGPQLPSIQPSNYHGHPGSSKGPAPLSLNEQPNRPLPYQNGAATPSPTSYYFPQNSHTPNSLSPSGFPAPRNSPYKPVRGVNTLLVPPPSASMHNPQNLSYDQMHYQPLGQPKSERRTGVLPYLPFNTWSHSQGHQPQHPSFSTA